MQDVILIQDSDNAEDGAEGGTVQSGGDLAVPVPSGQAVTWTDVIWNVPGPNGMAARFRFVAPAIAKGAGNIDEDQAHTDMLALCRNFAVGVVAKSGQTPAQIIISLSDRPVVFGDKATDATQFFEAYDLKDGDCEWSLF